MADGWRIITARSAETPRCSVGSGAGAPSDHADGDVSAYPKPRIAVKITAQLSGQVSGEVRQQFELTDFPGHATDNVLSVSGWRRCGKLGGVGTERSGHPDDCAVVTLRSVIVKRAAWISTLHPVTVTRNLVKNRPPQPLARS